MRYRQCGDRIVARVADCARASVPKDPRAKLSELRAELARQESMERSSTMTHREFPDLARQSRERIEKLQKEIRSLDFWINDSRAPAPAPAPTPVSLAEINRRNAEFWKKGE